MKKLIPILLLLLIIGGCKKEQKDVNQLPPPTHIGANTLMCKIDGRIFKINKKWSRIEPDGVYSIPFINSEWVISGSTTKENIHFEFPFNNSSDLFTYPLGELQVGLAKYTGYTDGGTIPTGINTFTTNQSNVGSISITHATKEFASGTFAFDAINSKGTVIHITEGQFDIGF